MLAGSIKLQLKIMIYKKEFKYAALATLAYACISFVFVLTEFQGVDISQIKDANQLICFSQLNRLWFFFSLLYPFLVVLPFSTSYLDDCENQVLPIYFSRVSKISYYLSKLLACFIGTTLVILIPFLFNIVLCNLFLPHNHNTWFGEYSMGNYYRQLLGTNILYNTPHSEMPLLKIYLRSPFLYNILYLLLFSGFSGLLGACTLSVSFLLRVKKIALFVPPFAIIQLLRVLDAYYFSLSLETGVPYTNYNILNYVVPTVSKGHNYALFISCVFIILWLIFTSTICAIKNDLKNIQ